MKKLFIILFLFSTYLLYAESDSVLTFSEIMFYPQSGNNEFIEIYNLSSTENIDLNNFKIKYYTSSPDIITSAGFGTVLPPNSFAVILENDYDLENGIYKNIIPSTAIVLKISDNTFGSSGMSNTTGRQIIMLNQNDDTIDVYTYTANNKQGNSDEKILLLKDNSDTNWENSKLLNGTPGMQNSVSPLTYDLALLSVNILPPNPKLNETISILAYTGNIGIATANNITIELYNDSNFDSIPSVSELIYSKSISGLKYLDSTLITTNLLIDHQCSCEIIAKVIFDEDEDTSNNYFIFKFFVQGKPIKYNDLVINEIMFAPSPDEPEWVELYNRSSAPIYLNGWKIGDNSKFISITSGDIFIQPSSYLVISKDSFLIDNFIVKSPVIITNFPSLNNTGDAVVIKDSSGTLIDSVEYLPSWGGLNGKSLERVSADVQSANSFNWKTSEDLAGATPGYINSVTQKDNDIALIGIIFTPLKPVTGNNVSISVKVLNKGKQSGIFSLLLYEDTNQDSLPDVLVSNLESLSLNPSDTALYSFNYSIDNISTEHYYYIQAEMENDQGTSNNYLYKSISPGFYSGTILINEVMFAPLGNEPEWIELVNASNNPVNLKDWTIGDIYPLQTNALITDKDLTISPNEFLVIAKDSAIKNYYHDINSKIIVAGFGTLNNSEDGIVVFDFSGSMIDSLHYKGTWGSSRGNSLERLSLTSLTNDSTNWVPSLSENKGTPGEANSIINISSYKRNSLIINEIMFDPGEDNSEFIEFLNLSNGDINIGGWKILTGEKSKYELSGTNKLLPAGSFFVLAADSSLISKYNLTELNPKTILNTSSLDLSNDNELILLSDMKNNVIDSVHYYSSWNNKNFTSTKNISLERINTTLDGNSSSNWSSSTCNAGATPGSQNSIFTTNQNISSKISLSPNPFSPDNDGYEDYTVINYYLSQQAAQVRVKIYDSRGKLIRTLLNNQASGRNGSVIFNGMDDSGRALRMGIYIVFLEAIDSFSSTVENLKTIAVIARKLK